MSTPAYTFNDTLPTDKDYIRQRVGDMNGLPQWFLSDGTINALITRLGSIDEAAAQAAEAIGAMCVQLAEQTQVKSTKIMYGRRAENMYALATRIRDMAQPGVNDPPNPGSVSGTIVGVCPGVYGVDIEPYLPQA